MHPIWESFGHGCKTRRSARFGGATPQCRHTGGNDCGFIVVVDHDCCCFHRALVFRSHSRCQLARGCPQPGIPSLRPASGFLRARNRWHPLVGRHVAKSLRGIKPASKLLLIPFLLYQFRRSQRGPWVFSAFLGSRTLLMIVSHRALFSAVQVCVDRFGRCSGQELYRPEPGVHPGHIRAGDVSADLVAGAAIRSGRRLRRPSIDVRCKYAVCRLYPDSLGVHSGVVRVVRVAAPGPPHPRLRYAQQSSLPTSSSGRRHLTGAIGSQT
jgi:hypothetical protein